jgi:hypothetical protein
MSQFVLSRWRVGFRHRAEQTVQRHLREDGARCGRWFAVINTSAIFVNNATSGSGQSCGCSRWAQRSRDHGDDRTATRDPRLSQDLNQATT